MHKLHFSRRTFLQMTFGTIFLGAGSYVYGHYFEPTQLEISSVHLALPRLTPEFDGYRIVQISDIHLDDELMTSAHLATITEMVNELLPDLIVITGDFITASHHGGRKIFPEDLVPSLSLLAARDGVLAILGNHDHEENPSMVQQVIRESGMINVGNSVHTLNRDTASLHIAGVDDVLEGQDDFELVLDQLSVDGAAILLVHEPDFADTSAKTKRFDLQLSGHSHGGQIIFPYLDPPILPPLAREYPLGLYQIGEMLLYTNRGLGMVPPQVRFNCRPEITIFTLKTV